MVKKSIFSGVQPSNNLTIGNYIGAIKNWVSLQHDYDSIFCIVNLHAITVAQNPKELYDNTLATAATYLACGIDYKSNPIIIQSDINEHAELGWILGCMTPMGWLSRMTQFKDKSGKNKEKVGMGLFAYPALMAADILLYNTTHVPVGDDQKQHIEMARDLAQSFNNRYGIDHFTIPEPLIVHEGARIMSLRDGTKKMSKSDPSEMSRILLADSKEEIVMKIRKAKTDNELLPDSLEQLHARVEAKNLLTIFATFSDLSLVDTVNKFAGQEFSYLKNQLTDLLVEKISPITEKINLYLSDKSELANILQSGLDRVRPIARDNILKTKEIVGLARF